MSDRTPGEKPDGQQSAPSTTNTIKTTITVLSQPLPRTTTHVQTTLTVHKKLINTLSNLLTATLNLLHGELYQSHNTISSIQKRLQTIHDNEHNTLSKLPILRGKRAGLWLRVQDELSRLDNGGNVHGWLTRLQNVFKDRVCTPENTVARAAFRDHARELKIVDEEVREVERLLQRLSMEKDCLKASLEGLMKRVERLVQVAGAWERLFVAVGDVQIDHLIELVEVFDGRLLPDVVVGAGGVYCERWAGLLDRVPEDVPVGGIECFHGDLEDGCRELRSLLGIDPV